MNIVEPCCAHKQLPRLLVNSKDRPAFFATYGDVTFRKFYNSLAQFVPSPCVMFLTIHEPDINIYRLLHQCFERKWITHLILTTNKDCTEALRRELAPYTNNISHTASPLISYHSESMLLASVLCDSSQGKSASLYLQGPMFLAPREQYTTYTLWLTAPVTDASASGIKELISPILSRHRIKPLLSPLPKELLAK